jgi:hypothetical protein
MVYRKKSCFKGNKKGNFYLEHVYKSCLVWNSVALKKDEKQTWCNYIAELTDGMQYYSKFEGHFVYWRKICDFSKITDRWLVKLKWYKWTQKPLENY